MNLDDLPSSIIEFFTPEKYAQIPDYERQHLSNLRQNYEFLRRAGMTVHPPEFMLRNKSKKKKRKRVSHLTTDSSEGSDAEWTPAMEALSNKKVRKKKIIWPVLKSITKACNSVSETVPSTSVQKKAEKLRQIKTNTPEKEIHEYSLRKKSRKSYMSLKIPDDDEYLYCEECNFEFPGDCLTHGALLHVDDTEVPHSCRWGVDPDYCRKTLPSGLVIKKSRIPGARLGIFATRDFPSRTRFGPYEGKKEKNEEIAEKSGYCWRIYKDGKLSHFVDGRDPSKSNWMRFVNCARSEDEQYVTAYQHQGKIYYRAHRHISAGTEILVYYGDSYAKDIGIKTDVDGCQSLKFLKLERKTQHKSEGKSDGNKNHSLDKSVSSILQYDGRVQIMQNKSQSKNVILCYEGNISTEEKYIPLSLQEQADFKVCFPRGVLSDTLPQYKKVYAENTLSVQRSERNTLSVQGSEGNTLSVQSSENTYVTQCLDVLETTKKYCKMVKFVSSDHLEKRKTLTGEKPFKCDVCGACFSQNIHLKNHKRIHTGEKPFMCDVCGTRFRQTRDLKKHIRIHTGEKPFKCNVCCVWFRHSSALKNHIRIHTREKPFKCNVCGAGFSRVDNLKYHKRIHTKEKPFKCDDCGAGFRQTSDLKKHIRIHTGEKPFKCDVCGTRFRQTSALKNHIRIHTREKPFKCNVCGAGFSRVDHLKKHKRIHTGEKPFKCDVCGTRFRQTSTLKNHIRIHTREKPFKCNVCGAGFSRVDHLKKHKRIHTGEKPFKCDVCGAGFRQTSHLKKHKRIHTGEKLFKCDVCDACFTRVDHLKCHKRIYTGENFSSVMCVV